jgi:aspartyl protease family protein
MRGALFTMIVIGSAIGFLWPIEKRGAPAAAAADAEETYVKPHDTTLARAANGHFYADALVNKKMVHFVVDTGATDVALTIEDAHLLGLKFDPAHFEVVGTGASGAVMGQEVSLNEVSLDGKRAYGIKGVVLQGLAVSLLGQNYLRQLHGVQIDGDTMTLR